jgi:hypothetical protein
MKSPNEIMNDLNPEDKLLVAKIIQMEADKQYVEDLKPSSALYKELVSYIQKLIQQEVRDEN